ncbi:TetR/AcrR family transcriptional regulator [Microbacterium sulfonylureivorans]|uniref:TetR/AcrR family transcriptional regulator n=1 Tax=Microbacterium sulfonylureivorans TaxID=2486854 RepID=UPI00197BC19F|nr:TetR/AcrR family transcriptional regulator [Microbacterium sulfonylureivorans]
MGKADTRARLLAAALELVAAKGFESTTAGEIAARAGVSEMTFFRHFPTKAAVLVDDPYDPLIAEAIRRRPREESAWEATVRGVADAWEAVSPPEEAAVRERLAIVAATPSLRAALAEGSAATTAAIVDALRDRAMPAEAGVVAAAIVAGLNEALLNWSMSGERMDAAIREALRVLGSR